MYCTESTRKTLTYLIVELAEVLTVSVDHYGAQSRSRHGSNLAWTQIALLFGPQSDTTVIVMGVQDDQRTVCRRNRRFVGGAEVVLLLLLSLLLLMMWLPVNFVMVVVWCGGWRGDLKKNKSIYLWVKVEFQSALSHINSCTLKDRTVISILLSTVF